MTSFHKKSRFFISALALSMLPCLSVRAVLVYVTDGSNLVSFDSATPGSITVTPISGLGTGNVVLGMDYRAETAVIYAQAGPATPPSGPVIPGDPNSGYNFNPLYIIDQTTGSATQQGDQFVVTSRVPFPMGFEFDQKRGTLRLISDGGLNLSVDPLTGTVGAHTPFYLDPPFPFSGTFAGAAFTPGGGALYLIDAGSGSLFVSDGDLLFPPTLQVVGSLGLGANLNPEIGFDISPWTGEAFATITVGGLSQLYSIDLASGQATSLGVIGDGTVSYRGLAVPEPSAALLVGSAVAGLLWSRRRQTTI